MWLKIFRVLCFVGWHLWEYLYADTGLKDKTGDRIPHHRRCSRCGTQQKQLKGSWTNDKT